MRSIACVALLLAGCLRALGPDVGPALGSGSGSGTDTCQGSSCPDATIAPGCDVDSDPSTTVSFLTDIYNGVLNRNKCRNCHTGGGDGIQQSGLNMATYATLRAGGSHSGTKVIIDGMPCESIIVQKVGPAPPFGSRMPKDNPRLSVTDMNLLKDWIFEGARDN